MGNLIGATSGGHTHGIADLQADKADAGKIPVVQSDGHVAWGTAGSGSGDVTGPGSSTDGGLAVFDGTGGDAVREVESGDVDAILTSLGLTEVADTRVVQLGLGKKGDNVATGDGQGMFFTVPSFMNGWNLTAVSGVVDVAGTTGTMDVQIRRLRVATPADMLSTKLTWDSTERRTSTAATPAVINTSNDDIATGDDIYIDVDAVHSTPATGVVNVSLTFTKP